MAYKQSTNSGITFEEFESLGVAISAENNWDQTPENWSNLHLEAIAQHEGYNILIKTQFGCTLSINNELTDHVACIVRKYSPNDEQGHWECGKFTLLELP